MAVENVPQPQEIRTRTKTQVIENKCEQKRAELMTSPKPKNLAIKARKSFYDPIPTQNHRSQDEPRTTMQPNSSKENGAANQHHYAEDAQG